MRQTPIHPGKIALPVAIDIPCGQVTLQGDLCIPPDAPGIVIFAHGSGSSRCSPRNQRVAQTLRDAGFGTLLFDLLTQQEELADLGTREFRFDMELLSARLLEVTSWLLRHPYAQAHGLGYFGSSTGAAAALIAAAALGGQIEAVVSRGGRPDLAAESLPQVTAPTLLIVGGLDEEVLALNEQALAELRCPKHLEVIAGATHLFEEPGALEEVAQAAAYWFTRHLRQHSPQVTPQSVRNTGQ